MPLSHQDQLRASAYRKALGDSYKSMIESRPALWEKTQQILREWLEAREQGSNDGLYELLRDWAAHVLLREYLDCLEKESFAPLRLNLRLMTSGNYWGMYVQGCVPTEIHNSYDALYVVMSQVARAGMAAGCGKERTCP